MNKRKGDQSGGSAATGAEARPVRRATAAPTPPLRREPSPIASAAPLSPPASARAATEGKATKAKTTAPKTTKPRDPTPPSSATGAPPKQARTPPHAARRGALVLLAAVRGGATLGEAAGTLEMLSPADRARAQRLALAVLRHLNRADAVLAPLMQRRPRPETLDLLRLGVTEMLGLGEAAHGVVDTAVSIARAGGPKAAAASGMVNAVLRRAAGARAVWDGAGPTPLPEWLAGPVAACWGVPVLRAIEAAHEAAPPVDLTGKPGADMPGTALPTGSHRLPDGAQVSAQPGYAAGDWWVQDAAAALPVRLLDPRPGETVADLCAAPGGKTMQLAAAGAEVTAIDIAPARLARVRENLARTGLDARLVAADATGWRPETPLDAVLLDAPCSATGTIRRHPELPLIRDGAGLSDLVALQARLIDHALSLLRPGGRLVYAVCSLLPAEGEDQLAAALARNPGLTVERPAIPGLPADWITDAGAIRTRPDFWPDLGGLDGFFMVRLRRG